MYTKQVAVAMVPFLMAVNAQVASQDIDFEMDRIPANCMTQCASFYGVFNECEERIDMHDDSQKQQEAQLRQKCYCLPDQQASASACGGCIQSAFGAQGAPQIDTTGINAVLASCGWTATTNGNTAGQPGQPGQPGTQTGSQPGQPGQPGQTGSQPNQSGVSSSRVPLPSAAPGKPGNTTSTTSGKASPSGSGVKPTQTNGQKVNGAAGIASASVFGMGAAVLFAAMMLQ